MAEEADNKQERESLMWEKSKEGKTAENNRNLAIRLMDLAKKSDVQADKLRKISSNNIEEAVFDVEKIDLDNLPPRAWIGKMKNTET